MAASTLGRLVSATTDGERSRAALIDEDGVVTTWGDLGAEVSAWRRRLGDLDVGGDDRIAVALPNGTTMATTFLGVAAHAICAPLNPGYTPPEADFYLEDLDPALVVITGDGAPGVRASAEARGLRILDLDTEVPSPAATSAPQAAGRGVDDIALILHTSGTTSRPKQVPLTHGNLMASAGNVAATLGLSAEDRCGNVMPLFHIHGLVACLLASLRSGGSVLCTRGFDPSSFLRTIGEHECTWYSAVPTVHQGVLVAARTRPDDADAVCLRLIRSSSSSLPPSVMHDLEARFDVPVIEAYGMTEAAHQMTSNQLPPGDRRAGSVGIAAGPEVSVIGPDGGHVDPGVTGELVIQGPNVMSGYLTPPEANETAFADGGWFRTGDQGVIDEHGMVTITGRLKELINRAGEKIAPREIDEALLADDEVAEALAFAVPHPTLGEDVAAVVVPTDPDTFDADAVRRRLGNRLAEFKIPRQLITVAELPKGATGKPARIGLAEKLGLVPPESAVPGVIDDDPLVAAAAAVLGAVLRRPIGADDDFVRSGGDSLSALAASAAAEEVFGVALPPGALLGDLGTARALAGEVRRRRTDGIGEVEPDGIVSATRRLWIQQQLDPDSTAYNAEIALRIRGTLPEERIDQAVAHLVRRHDALRTRLELRDGAVVADVADASDPLIDRRAIDEFAIDAFVADLVAAPLDLGAGAIRIGVGCVGPTDRVLVLVTHHALVDGPSRHILRRELAELLAGTELPPPSTPPQRRSRRRHDSATFWADELRDLPDPPELPPASAGRAGPAVVRSERVVPQSLVDGVRSLASSLGATVFAVLLAAHVETLRRMGGREDIVVALPVTSRTPDDAAVVGMFIETVPVRVRLADVDSVRDLVDECRRALTTALAHGDVPFDELIELAGAGHSRSTQPLATTMCQLRPPEADELPTSAHHQLEDIDVAPTGARFDLSVDFALVDDGLEIVVDADGAIVGIDAGDRYADRLARMLDGLVHQSDLRDIDICSAEEHETMVRVGEGGAPLAAGLEDVVAVLDELARDEPHAVAVVGPTGAVTTRSELAARSRAFAVEFHRAGAAPARPVGIALPRGADAIAAMIGAWRVGSPYLPLQPGVPTDRDRASVSQAGALAVVTGGGDWGVEVIDPAQIAADSPTAPESVACEIAWIIPTSGSTGEPKLVPGPWRGLVNRLAWGRRVVPVEGPAAHRAPLVFVDHVAEVFGPLVAGQPLVVIDDETVRDPGLLATRLRDAGVTRLLVVPSLLRMLLAGLPRDCTLPELRTVITSGEALPPDVAAAWHERLPDARLVNIYGSTETSADATAADVEPGRPVTVGRPVDGFSVRVVTAAGCLCPPGAVGELWIAGDGVFDGYLVPGPDDRLVIARLGGDEARAWYRTGDRGRLDEDGNVVVLGRTDRQVEVRGVRIEPEEIEGAFRRCTSVVDAAVGVENDALVAMVVLASGARPDTDALRAELARRLPASHVPNRIRVVDQLPRTATGKVDRARIEVDRGELEGRPPNERERWIIDQWLMLLDLEHPPSVDDDFFALGGQSIAAVELFARIESSLGIDVPVATIFDCPTPASLAVRLDGADRRTKPSRSEIVELSAGRTGAPTVAWCAPGRGLGLGPVRQHLGDEFRLLVLSPPGFRKGERPPRTVRSVASRSRRQLLKVGFTGPLIVGGNSFGGLVAVELVHELRDAGVDVGLLVMFDSGPPGVRPGEDPPAFGGQLWWRLRMVKRRRGLRLGAQGRAERVRRSMPRAAWRWRRTASIDIPVLLFTTEQRRTQTGSADLGWSRLLTGPVTVIPLDGDHGQPATEWAPFLADELRRWRDAQ